MAYSPRGHKESDTTQPLNNNIVICNVVDNNIKIHHLVGPKGGT